MTNYQYIEDLIPNMFLRNVSDTQTLSYPHVVPTRKMSHKFGAQLQI